MTLKGLANELTFPVNKTKHFRDSVVGWHPAPNGEPELWYWDGVQWIDPIEAVEAQITELITPHLEKMYREGFLAGFNHRG